MIRSGFPEARGLYAPRNEKDSCGVAIIAHVGGERSHSIVSDGLTALIRMSHRVASGPEENTGGRAPQKQKQIRSRETAAREVAGADA